jgi:hypothetical protein
MKSNGSKIYTIAFRMGVLFDIVLFTIFNVASFIVNQSEYENRGIYFAPAGFKWGFPFDWGRQYAMLVEGGTIFNLVFWIAGGFFFGFTFKFVWSKIPERSALLK